MLHLADNLIADIADFAHNSLSVFVHKQTHELAMYVADSNYLEPDDEEYQKVQQNPNDYFQIKSMTSDEAYLMRENFIETVENKSLQDDLKVCLYGKKNKFANFKHRVRNSEYEQKWFEFEAEEQNKYICKQLEKL